ncbi:hypothetical protein DXG03_006879 [Asterophora parasitica]|uniref:Retroviral polymerase SH3-like domain-containing protein n=1 Tax=Asterophora parasitica TaxID=117018 RepID=A0A9P7FNF8_9AGAR|nr:hypothetical protein DXG03_006879 [Asterophora parasitica]
MLGASRGSKFSKLDPKLRPFIFVGLSDESKAWHYYSAKTCKVLTLCNVIFMRNTPEVVIDDDDDPVLLEGEKAPTIEPAQVPATSLAPAVPPPIPKLKAQPPSKIPIPPHEKSAQIAQAPQLLNYQLINNPDACSPSEPQFICLLPE